MNNRIVAFSHLLGNAVYLISSIIVGLLSTVTLSHLLLFVLNVSILPLPIIDGSKSFTPSLQLLDSALLNNAALFVIFLLQHSIMTRHPVKKFMKYIISENSINLLYTLGTVLCAINLMVFWSPIPLKIWEIQNDVLKAVITAMNILSVLGGIYSILILDPLTLFGLKFMERKKTNDFYASAMRHSNYAFIMATMWCTPTMTVGRLFFAAGVTVYIFLTEPDPEGKNNASEQEMIVRSESRADVQNTQMIKNKSFPELVAPDEVRRFMEDFRKKMKENQKVSHNFLHGKTTKTQNINLKEAQLMSTRPMTPELYSTTSDMKTTTEYPQLTPKVISQQGHSAHWKNQREHLNAINRIVPQLVHSTDTAKMPISKPMYSEEAKKATEFHWKEIMEVERKMSKVMNKPLDRTIQSTNEKVMEPHKVQHNTTSQRMMSEQMKRLKEYQNKVLLKTQQRAQRMVYEPADSADAKEIRESSWMTTKPQDEFPESEVHNLTQKQNSKKFKFSSYKDPRVVPKYVNPALIKKINEYSKTKPTTLHHAALPVSSTSMAPPRPPFPAHLKAIVESERMAARPSLQPRSPVSNAGHNEVVPTHDSQSIMSNCLVTPGHIPDTTNLEEKMANQKSIFTARPVSVIPEINETACPTKVTPECISWSGYPTNVKEASTSPKTIPKPPPFLNFNETKKSVIPPLPTFTEMKKTAYSTKESPENIPHLISPRNDLNKMRATPMPVFEILNKDVESTPQPLPDFNKTMLHGIPTLTPLPAFNTKQKVCIPTLSKNMDTTVIPRPPPLPDFNKTKIGGIATPLIFKEMKKTVYSTKMAPAYISGKTSLENMKEPSHSLKVIPTPQPLPDFSKMRKGVIPRPPPLPDFSKMKKGVIPRPPPSPDFSTMKNCTNVTGKVIPRTTPLSVHKEMRKTIYSTNMTPIPQHISPTTEKGELVFPNVMPTHFSMPTFKKYNKIVHPTKVMSGDIPEPVIPTNTTEAWVSQKIIPRPQSSSVSKEMETTAYSKTVTSTCTSECVSFTNMKETSASSKVIPTPTTLKEIEFPTKEGITQCKSPTNMKENTIPEPPPKSLVKKMNNTVYLNKTSAHQKMMTPPFKTQSHLGNLYVNETAGYLRNEPRYMDLPKDLDKLREKVDLKLKYFPRLGYLKCKGRKIEHSDLSKNNYQKKVMNNTSKCINNKSMYFPRVGYISKEELSNNL